ncbi:BON domain-containing protein [Cupriavidus campinensis]
MQTEDQDTTQTSPDEEDELLRERVGTCIAEACGGDMPDGVAVHVVNRHVTLSGQVEDIDLARRIEQAAATPPGILGVSNQMTTRVPPPNRAQAHGS